jgi:DNA-binding transcriptional ArsR family regulator
MQTEQEFNGCADRLKAIADPSRLQIVEALFDGPRTVGEIAELLDTTIKNVSHHLNVMRATNILTATRQGRFIQYGLHPDMMAIGKGKTRAINLGCCTFQLTAAKRPPSAPTCHNS